jgi:hypothetical protein
MAEKIFVEMVLHFEQIALPLRISVMRFHYRNADSSEAFIAIKPNNCFPYRRRRRFTATVQPIFVRMINPASPQWIVVAALAAGNIWFSDIHPLSVAQGNENGSRSPNPFFRRYSSGSALRIRYQWLESNAPAHILCFGVLSSEPSSSTGQSRPCQSSPRADKILILSAVRQAIA